MKISGDQRAQDQDQMIYFRSVMSSFVHPLDNHLAITYGKGHLVFWTRRKDGFFDRHDMVHDERTVTCLDVLESGDLVAGDDSGMYNPQLFI